MSNPSTKPAKSRPTRNNVQTSNAGYLACDDPMIIPSDTSVISDWEWTAGGFPCRDVISERIISDNIIQQEPSIPSLDPLDPLDSLNNSGQHKNWDLRWPIFNFGSAGFPISIIPEGRSSKQPHSTTHLSSDSKTKLPEYPSDLREKTKREIWSTSQTTRLTIPLMTIQPIRNLVRRKSLPLEMNINSDARAEM